MRNRGIQRALSANCEKCHFLINYTYCSKHMARLHQIDVKRCKPINVDNNKWDAYVLNPESPDYEQSVKRYNKQRQNEDAIFHKTPGCFEMGKNR